MPIQLSENCIIDLDTKKILLNNEEQKIRACDWPVLETLLAAEGKPLSNADLEKNLYGKRALDNCRSRIRKAIGDKKIKSGSNQFKYVNDFNGETRLNRPLIPAPAPTPTEFLPFPDVMTNSVVPHIAERDILCRGEEIGNLKRFLSNPNQKQAILIHGMGGLGKTTLARWIYSDLGSQYDSIGWVEYRGNLRSSILSSFTLETDIENETVRWERIKKKLKTPLISKLLIIDNVDLDSHLGQDPKKDTDLKDISGWRNLTVVLTSRLDHFTGYTPFPLKPINLDGCVKLFYHYFGTYGTDRHTVEKLVKLSGYNTLVVEVLAKSAWYHQRKLPEFLSQLETVGFRFPTLCVHTDHRDTSANAAEQLRKLFDLQTRTETEQKILWDFCALSPGTLSFDEIRHLLGYDDNQLYPLIREGWLTHDEGFSMHPLVHETILLAPEQPQRLTRLLYHILNGTLIPAQTTFSDSLRLLNLATRGLEHLNMPPSRNSVQAYLNLGRLYLQRGQVSAAEKLMRCAISLQKSLAPAQREEQALLAECYKDLAYLLSYTNARQSEAMSMLNNSIQLWKKAMRCNETDYRPQYAETCDYLGYLLSDSPVPYTTAETILQKSLDLWYKLEQDSPEKWKGRIAWSLDNLGYLLSRIPARRKDAAEHLSNALKLRLLLEEREPGKHTSEIAWTCNNLAILLHADPEQQADAEHLYRQVLNTRSTQEQAAPGSVTADVAIICGNLGILYTQTKGIKAHDLLSEALEINQKLESEYPGVYSSELANSYLNLAGFYVSQNAFDEARPLYIKALNIYNDPTKGHIPEMADIFWNQGILESLANPNNPDARRNFQLAATAWQMVYETIRSRPETDIWDQEELYSTSLKELAASFGDSAPLPDTPALLLFYLQSGSRKNRLLFQEKKHQPSACKS